MAIHLPTNPHRQDRRIPTAVAVITRRIAYLPLLALALLACAWSLPASAQTAPRAFVTSVWNPEDMVRLPGTPWVVVSAMRSRLRSGGLLVVDVRDPRAAVPLYPATTGVPAGPDPEVFFPHGLDVRELGDGRFELLVVDHGGGESIAHFRVRTRGGETPIIERANRTELPPGAWANGVVALPDGGFAITSMFDPRDDGFMAKFTAAEATGGLWRWSPRIGWQELAAPRLSGGNGIAVSRDGTTLFAAEWAARRIWRVPLDGGEARSVEVSFLPDNFRWTNDGRLLIAGQTSTPEQVFACEEQRRRCPMGFKVVTVDPMTLGIEPLIDADEDAFTRTGFGGATGALQVGEQIWVGSFTGDRIAAFARCAGDCLQQTEAQDAATQ